jgi:hypothetical protein
MTYRSRGYVIHLLSAFIAYWDYFANGTESPSADHPFVLQRSISAGGIGQLFLLRHGEGRCVREAVNDIAMRAIVYGNDLRLGCGIAGS